VTRIGGAAGTDSSIANCDRARDSRIGGYSMRQSESMATLTAHAEQVEVQRLCLEQSRVVVSQRTSTREIEQAVR
jgi:hypothetical protein